MWSMRRGIIIWSFRPSFDPSFIHFGYTITHINSSIRGIFVYYPRASEAIAMLYFTYRSFGLVMLMIFLLKAALILIINHMVFYKHNVVFDL
jgi:hypothetical protein